MQWLQLCGSLNILGITLLMGLEWILTFSSPVATAKFSKFAGISSAALFTQKMIKASSFRIWNSSAGIPSPPLALLVVTLPKDHLNSDSRMSGSMWVITPSWLSGSLRSFWIILLCILATSSEYLLCLLGPYHFCPFLCPSLHEMFPWYLIFLKRSLVFLISPLSFLFSFAFCFPYQLFVKPPQTTILPFCIFFLGVILITASCTILWTSLHSSSGTLSDLILWLYLSLLLYNHKGFDLGRFLHSFLQWSWSYIFLLPVLCFVYFNVWIVMVSTEIANSNWLSNVTPCKQLVIFLIMAWYRFLTTWPLDGLWTSELKSFTFILN